MAEDIIKSFRELIIYKRAFAVSLEVHKLTLDFPKFEQRALANDLRRSSKAICANIAEGFIRQKYSIAEFGRFLTIAEAASNETLVWLDYAVNLKYISKGIYDHLVDEYATVGAMISKLHRKI